MHKTTKWLIVSTVFFALMTLGLTATTVYFAKKAEKNSKIAPSPKITLEKNIEKDASEKQYSEMEVEEFSFDGKTIKLRCSETPDIDAAKEYVSVDPAPKGGLAFSVGSEYDYWDRRDYFFLKIAGDFAYRTNLTLKVRKGFPSCKSANSANKVVEALAEDYLHIFRREDEKPFVAFADEGRYLPPIGKRLIALECMNVSNITASISAVPGLNIVQMLSLEEGKYQKIYKNYWGGKEAFVEDLSVTMENVNIPAKNELNVQEEVTLPLPEENGIYFVKIQGEKGTAESRVVVISDLAITARRTKEKLFVWVTSLSTGTPVGGAKVRIFSSAANLLADGVADENGLCECVQKADGEPFIVVASSADESDATFVALAKSSEVEEDFSSEGYRPSYLEEGDLAAFAWTERGIYRHGERVFFHALVRGADMEAPKSIPLEVVLRKPGGVFMKKTVMTDEYGAFCLDDIVIPDDQPSGSWEFDVKVPGEKGSFLYSHSIKVEDFVPPQIKVETVIGEKCTAQEFSFDVSAEFMFGGAASGLASSGTVIFEDVAFAPKDWNGWIFGDERRGLKPNFTRLSKQVLGADGKAHYSASMQSSDGLPSAAVRATAQSEVLEVSGRPVFSRASATLHYYPFYIGTTLKNWIKRPDSGKVQISVACVSPDGKRLSESKTLIAKLQRLDTVYSYQTDNAGRNTWRSERIVSDVLGKEGVEIKTSSEENTLFTLPQLECGDYKLSIEDPDSEVSFSSSFYLSDWGDDTMRAELSNPSKVTITADKPFYRPGDKPKLCVRTPFTGKALLGVFRDDVIYTEVISLTNLTSEIELREISADFAPNIDVSISIVHGVSEKANHLAARAHGEASLNVRLSENEIPLKVAASVSDSRVRVDFEAPGAKQAIVTVVDEAVMMLTNEKTPNPNSEFQKSREGVRGLYDLYNRLLPLSGEDKLLVNGLKTGGGCDSSLLGRVSPVQSRRFKPLALWSGKVDVIDGKGKAEFRLPEFAGRIRVTVVAYSEKATGSASCQCKITPKLVVTPDAPRFVAPGDVFTVSLPLDNRAGEDGAVDYKIYTSFEGGEKKLFQEGSVHLSKDCRKLLPFDAVAPQAIGQMLFIFETEAFGEKHRHEIELPVRPAVAWRQTSGVEVLPPGKRIKLPKGEDSPMTRFAYSVSESPASELKDAIEWLSDYPHGCLEQTSSRIMPLVTAGGILGECSPVASSNRLEYIKAGVRRVLSMRQNDGSFAMWPDIRRNGSTMTDWETEASLYAAHFLFEVERSMLIENIWPSEEERSKVLSQVRSISSATYTSRMSFAAYACHTLVLAGKPNKGSMYSLYDNRDSLTLLSRARLARAFALLGDSARASELLSSVKAPSSVVEAAYMLLAVLEIDPDDKRVPELVKYLASRRGKERYSWGTTFDNAHAVMALGEYFRRQPASLGLSNVKEDGSELVNDGTGTAFVSWKRLDLPKLEDVKKESSGLSIRREFLTQDGTPYDISKASRGDSIVVRIELSSDEDRILNDLVIEDLLPGALEPAHNDVGVFPWIEKDAHSWVLRHELRDDRILVFSEAFSLTKNEKVAFHYSLRVVSAGTFALPAVAVEAMYQPELRASGGTGRIVVGY